MATENIMMDAVKRGGNRQELHEKIREHSMAAGAVVKQEGKENDLVDRIANDPAFGMTKEMIEEILEPKNFVGRAPQQTEEFINEIVKPVLDENKSILRIIRTGLQLQPRFFIYFSHNHLIFSIPVTYTSIKYEMINR